MTKNDSNYYINRELSWLDFNARVLDEAADPSVPLIDRLKFTAIFSNNLDEFFMVRVAGINQQLYSKSGFIEPSGLTVREQLSKIRKKVSSLVDRQYRQLNETIMPELRMNNIFLLSPQELTPYDRNELTKYFLHHIFPVLTPVAVDPSHPFPILNNCTIEIAVWLKNSKSTNLKAFVEVPKVLPRFIKLAGRSNEKESFYILLEDVILAHIGKLFSKCEILGSFAFRITRDMDFNIDEDGVADLLVHIEKKLKGRRKRETIRLEIQEGADNSLKQWLIKKLNLPCQSVYTLAGPLDLAGFFELSAKEQRKGLVEQDWPAFESPYISDREPVFESIKKEGNIALFHPYQKFDPVIRFLNEAADDPDVLAIKQTLYRVSGDSPIVQALQRAAENGKQVTVIVELKARFDEQRNITWAKKLEESGAHVIYGIAGLKIHCKALLVIRREAGLIRRYLHLSTGNYNDKTARLYTDIGYFTTDLQLCSDICALFNIMTGYSEFREWNKISASPFNLRQTFISLIDRERRLSTKHTPGHIIAKMNSLVDPELIEHLYNAAYAGVKIDLIVRGICCLKPGIDTDNINVISIIDRFLEHSRVFYFANGGMPEYYLSSADWMPRNLDRRIELLFAVQDNTTRNMIDTILKIQLNDKCKARVLKNNAKYKLPKNNMARSQAQTYELFKSLVMFDDTRNQPFAIFEKYT